MKRLSSPLDVQVELTEACNQICRHCYNYWRQERKPPSGELATEQFLNIARQIHSAKVGGVTLTGGEPMLRKEVLFAMVSEFHNLGIDVGMNSNGALVTNEDARTLKQCGLDHALISVLGPESVHNLIAGPGGDFKKTTNGIINLLEAGIYVAVNMPVSQTNIHSVLETAEIVKNLGIKNFCSGPIVPSCKSNIPLCLSPTECKACLRDLLRVNSELGLNIDILEPLARCLFTAEEEKEFARFLGNRTCSAAVSSCAISSKGFMRPCIQSDAIYGNVLPDKFLDVWASMAEWSSPEILPKKCLECHSVMSCEGGCRMSAKITSGSYNGPDMYMTEPLFDPERISIPQTEKDTECELKTNDLFEFNKRCIIRREEGGYVTYTANRLEYLTPKGFDFLSLMKRLEFFSIASLAKETGYSEDNLKPVVKKFLGSNVIKRKDVCHG